MAAVPSTPSNAGASGVPSVARGGQAVLHHQQLDVLLPQLAPQLVFVLASKPIMFDQQRVVDAVQTLCEGGR